jgi:hypothetical protein
MFDPPIDDAPSYDELVNKVLEQVNKIAALESKVEKFTSTNTQRDENLLCGLTGVKCGNRVRVCNLPFGKCSGQRKSSPV